MGKMNLKALKRIRGNLGTVTQHEHMEWCIICKKISFSSKVLTNNSLLTASAMILFHFLRDNKVK